MDEHTLEIAGLRTLLVRSTAAPRLAVVVLHGYAMVPEDLSPFAASLGVPAEFYFPEGPLAAEPAGRAWWPIDGAERAAAVASGPRDLAAQHPSGAPSARARLLAFLEAVRLRSGRLSLTLVGFSQGGMLAADTLLREQVAVAALALLSSSRICADEWRPLVHRLHRTPVLVSHGRLDQDLAFSAGEALRDLLALAGGPVTWVPHEQGHVIPLAVWRQLRKFLAALG